MSSLFHNASWFYRPALRSCRDLVSRLPLTGHRDWPLLISQVLPHLVVSICENGVDNVSLCRWRAEFHQAGSSNQALHVCPAPAYTLNLTGSQCFHGSHTESHHCKSHEGLPRRVLGAHTNSGRPPKREVANEIPTLESVCDM